MNWLLVVAGGMVGAPLRYLTDRAVQARHDSVLPWGTFMVNVVGCLVLGLLTGRGTRGSRGLRPAAPARDRAVRCPHDVLDLLLRDAPADRDGRTPPWPP